MSLWNFNHSLPFGGAAVPDVGIALPKWKSLD